jgi:hypothetical protein
MAKTKLTTQQHLADHLCKMQNELTIACMKHWRTLGEGNLTQSEATEILDTLTAISEHVRFAKNCSERIIHGREDTGDTKQHQN